jgi:hypothetical protein
MPKIPTYERRGNLPVSYQGGLDSREREAFTVGSAGMAQTGKDIREAAQIGYKWYDQQQKEKASLDMAYASTDLGEKFSKAFEQLSLAEERDIAKYQKADLTDPSLDGLVNKTTQVVDKLMADEAYLQLADKNKYFRAEFEKFGLRFREAATAKAVDAQSKFHVQAVEVGIQDGLEKAAVHVSNDPTQLDGTMMVWRTVLGDMDDKNIPDSMKGLTAVGKKPDNADKYIGVARPGVLQKAKENLNKVAEVSWRRMIADNPKAAHEALKQLGSTPEGRWKLEKLYGFTGDQYAILLNASKTSAEFINVKALYELDTQLDDAVAAALTGTTPSGFGSVKEIEAKVYAVLDPNDPKSREKAFVTASKAHREITINKKIYGITANFSKQSSAEIVQTVKNLKPSGANAADEEKVQQGVAQRANSILSERERDAAAHYKQNPVVVQLIKDGKQGEANDYVIAAQRRDGVPDHELKVLSDSEVERERSYLTGTTGEDLGRRLRSFVTRYSGEDGKYKGQMQIVWRQLMSGPNALPAEYIWAANAMGTAAEPAIIRSLSIPQETVKKNMGTLQSTGVSWNTLDDRSKQIGDKYKRALTGGVSDRLEVYNSARALAVRMAATELVASGSNDSQRALEKAFKTITQGYDMEGGTYYIPMRRIGSGTQTSNLNPKQIHSNTERLRTDSKLLTTFTTLAAPGSMNPGNADPAKRQQAFNEILEKRSYWINNANSTGVQLVVETNGVPEPVVDNYGKTVEFTWDQLNNPTLLPKKKSFFSFGN